MGTARDVQTEGHKMSELDNYQGSEKFTHREKIALEYCDAIMDNPLYADDELWAKLHEEFTEPELVELGYYVGFISGGQRWLISLHTQHGELADHLDVYIPSPEESYKLRYDPMEGTQK